RRTRARSRIPRSSSSWVRRTEASPKEKGPAPRGLFPSSEASFLLQHPLHQLLCLGFTDLRIGGHRHRAPHAGAAFEYLLAQLVDGVLLAGVFGRHVLVGGADELLVNGVAGHAILLLREVGVGEGGA